MFIVLKGSWLKFAKRNSFWTGDKFIAVLWPPQSDERNNGGNRKSVVFTPGERKEREREREKAVNQGA